MDFVSSAQVNSFVLRKHSLTGQPAVGPIEVVVQRLCGLHASRAATPYLSLYARMPDFTLNQLDAALYTRRTLGRIRCMRKTLHILPSAFLPDYYRATVHLITRMAQPYLAYRGVTWVDYERCARRIEAFLGDAGKTAAEIREELSANFDVPAVVSVMSDLGRLARGEPLGGWRSSQYRYYRFATFFPDVDLEASHEDAAVQQVIRHYLQAFGPVNEVDMIWWTGLGKRTVRRALDSLSAEIEAVRLVESGEEALILRAQKAELLEEKPVLGTVHLLPELDPFLMGYRLRERFLNPAYESVLVDRSGNVPATVLVNGQVAGVWDAHDIEKGVMKLFFFASLARPVIQQICEKAEQLGLFLSGQPARIEICDQMTPLKQRTAGGFMTPLREV